MKQALIDELWDWAQPIGRVTQHHQLSELPVAARRYLEHAVPSVAPLPWAVRLRMHGEIKLKDWRPFVAEQVIAWPRGMVWNATVRMNGLPVRGFDRFVNGQGTMRWRLFGIVPLMAASGPDVTRSAAGRVMAETVWLPSLLSTEETTWTTLDDSRARAHLRVGDEPVDLTLTIDAQGRLKMCDLLRWGNPGGGQYQYVPFGAVVEDERRFAGYTIPSRLRVGWYVGTERFERQGEFFRVTVDGATYR